MDDDDVDDLWGPPPLVVKEDTFRKPLRLCEFWFDFRTDVLEESFQNERFCELVWRILNEKTKVGEIDELDKDVASSGSGGSSSDSDKTLSATLPDVDTSSAKSSLEENEATSSISEALTIETKDSTNDTEEIDPGTSLKPQEETGSFVTVEVVEDVDTSFSPVLESKIDLAEEHSCSSLVTHQAPENKSPSAISQENNQSFTLVTFVESSGKANATNEDGEILKDQQQQQSDSLQDMETASEPFTTESLLEMCDEPEKDLEAPCDEKSKSLMPEAVKKTVVKDELIMNMLTEARIKAESKALLNPGSVLIKKRKKTKGIETSLIRNTKQKVGGEAGQINTGPAKTSTLSAPKGPSVPTQLSDSTLDLIDRIRQIIGKTMSEPPVILESELNDKTTKELRCIAKELKLTNYYKPKKEDLLQRCIRQLKLQQTDSTEQRMMES